MTDTTDPQDLEAAKSYLTSLLNRNLRVHTTDSRMFLGQFKCTDSDRNIVLSHTYEYHTYHSPNASGSKSDVAMNATRPTSMERENAVKDPESRYLGLVVVPGEHIVKMEVEEFISQMGKAQEVCKLDK